MPPRLLGSAIKPGSGMRWSTAMTCSGLVPQVICGAMAATSIATSRSNVASASFGSWRQVATARSHMASLGANCRPWI
jgi:hypothetical protein